MVNMMMLPCREVPDGPLPMMADPAIGLDLLFDRVDRYLSDGDFETVNALLRTKSPLSLVVSLGMLSITRPARHRLPSREAFFDRVWAECVAAGRDAENLLGNLRE